MRFQKIGLTTVVLCTVGIQQSFSIDIVTKEKPNIVFILADDLGCKRKPYHYVFYFLSFILHLFGCNGQ